MTIPGRGDLSPRHHSARLGRWVAVVLVVVLLGAGGFATYRGLTGSPSGHRAAATPPCPVATPPTVPHGPKPHVVVDNATLTEGLAASVAKSLQARGFVVVSVGNTATTEHGIATVRYSADRLLAAKRVAAQIAGSRLVRVSGHRQLELDVGPGFHALASKPAAKQALLAALPTPTPTPNPTATSSNTASPSPSSSCTPRS